VDDSVVNPLSQAVGGASPPEAAAQKAPQALFDSDVACAVVARVEMKFEFGGLDAAHRAIEVEVDEML
jgi:hypothetical protein